MNLVTALRSSTIRTPRSLTPSELRSIWNLRASQLQLQDHIDPQADFEAFCADYQHPGLVWLLWEGDRVVGTYLQRLVPDLRGLRHLRI